MFRHAQSCGEPVQSWFSMRLIQTSFPLLIWSLPRNGLSHGSFSLCVQVIDLLFVSLLDDAAAQL